MESLIESFARHFPFMHWRAQVMQLRIDVHLPPTELENELETLYQRINAPEDKLYGMAQIPINLPGFLVRHRETDGEHYVYVEDTARKCLAGYTVFNRLIEVSRRADPYLRAPHSKYGIAYRRQGIASAIYKWWLNANPCLISGARQSSGSHALWHSLASQYELIYVDLRDKRLRHIGSHVDTQTLGDLHTRMIMLGKEVDLVKLGKLIDMHPNEKA